ncbi:MAG: hypothetical protein LUH19_03510 [Lachnospiraceae bacterium]|nr:hypothetical protein [Lachnospiraceae bacterium]
MAGKRIKIDPVIVAGLAILTLLSFLKGIFVSLDIDESYTVAQSFRLAQGDRLLLDMWEPHQFSAFLGAVFLKLWLVIYGSAEFSVLFLRIVSVMIHTGLGLALFCQLQRFFDKSFCVFLLFLHLNFLPKWVQSTEFELMHYWFLMGVFLLLNQYFSMKKGNPLLAALAGLCLLGSMMCYPSMLLLYPLYAGGICVLERRLHGLTGRKRFAGAAAFTAGALIPGLCFLGYLFSYLSFGELIDCLRKIALDPSHSENSFAERFFTYYLPEMVTMLQSYLGYFLLAAAICVILWAVVRRFGSGVQTSFRWEPVVLSVFLLTAVILCAVQLLGTLLGDQNQFYFQGRFLAVILPACYLGIRYRKQMGRWLYLLVLPGLCSFPGVLLMTNMGVNVSAAKTFPAVLGSLIIYGEYARALSRGQDEEMSVPGRQNAERLTLGQENAGKLFLALQRALVLFLLAGFLVCRLVLIRITGCGECTVLAPLEQIESGAAKGIYVLQKTAQVWNGNNQELDWYLREGDRLLYVGAENLIYVRDGIEAATPSTQGTTVFDESFLSYYEEDSDRLPTVIVVDRTFETVPEYNYQEENGAVFDWIEEHYADAEVIETDHMIIYRIK